MGESKDLRRVRRSCTDKAMRKLLLAAMHAAPRYRMTKSGVMFYGPGGGASAHLTCSDHRAIENFSADLRRVGITIEKGK